MSDDQKPRLEDYVSVPVISPAAYAIVRRALDEAEARTGAIAPSGVEKITPEQRFAVDMPSARPEEWAEPLRPSPLMRRLGYTAHPATCTHYRKRLYLGTTQWMCSDCGERL